MWSSGVKRHLWVGLLAVLSVSLGLCPWCWWSDCVFCGCWTPELDQSQWAVFCLASTSPFLAPPAKGHPMNTWGITLLLLAFRKLSVEERLRMWAVETGGQSSNSPACTLVNHLTFLDLNKTKQNNMTTTNHGRNLGFQQYLCQCINVSSWLLSPQFSLIPGRTYFMLKYFHPTNRMSIQPGNEAFF